MDFQNYTYQQNIIQIDTQTQGSRVRVYDAVVVFR